jgi:hypothetical protein
MYLSRPQKDDTMRIHAGTPTTPHFFCPDECFDKQVAIAEAALAAIEARLDWGVQLSLALVEEWGQP